MIGSNLLKKSSTFLMFVILVIMTVDAENRIKGLRKKDQEKMKISEKEFTCLDGSRTFPINFLNDNYCDCPDSSDEPGTNACPNGMFYCVNKGFKGKKIFSSQVRDGICDCCDGSDEEGKKECGNNCASVAESTLSSKREQIQSIKEGLVSRSQWVADATRQLNEEKTQLEQNKKKAEELEERKKKADELLQQAQQSEDQERQKHQQQHQQNQSSSIPTQDSTESMGVAHDHGSHSHEGHEHGHEDHEHEGHEHEHEHEGHEHEHDGDALSEEELKELESDKPSEGDKIIQDSKAIEDSEQVKALAEEGWFGKIRKWFSPTPSTPSSPQVTSKARDAMNEVRTELENVKSSISNAEKKLGINFGSENEYYNLYQKCFSVDNNEYTYELCVFDKVNQRPKNGGGATSLGNWGTFELEKNEMNYNGGQRCWGGPDRSAKILISCGKENRLFDPSEPNKCEYQLRFETPAACSPSVLSEIEQSVQRMLSGEEQD